METEILRLVERLKYAVILKDVKVNPKDEDIIAAMKKELKRFKVAENHEDSFAQKTKDGGK